MSQAIALMSIFVALLALLAYVRCCVMSDKVRHQCEKRIEFFAKWRTRHSRALQREMLPKKRLHEALKKHFSSSDCRAMLAVLQPDPCELAIDYIEVLKSADGFNRKRIEELQKARIADSERIGGLMCFVDKVREYRKLASATGAYDADRLMALRVEIDKWLSNEQKQPEKQLKQERCSNGCECRQTQEMA